jgi:hypothetical protein
MNEEGMVFDTSICGSGPVFCCDMINLSLF